MRNTTKAAAVVFLMLVTQFIFSQNPGEPPVDPGPAAPINDYILPMLVVALVMSYRVLLLKKR